MDIDEKLRNGDYETKLHFPVKPEKPRLSPNPFPPEARAYADAMEAYEPLLLKYKDDVSAFYAERGRLEQVVFRADVEETYGTKDNPKADKLWGIAYERGHGGGLSNVLAEYEELYELIL